MKRKSKEWSGVISINPDALLPGYSEEEIIAMFKKSPPMIYNSLPRRASILPIDRSPNRYWRFLKLKKL